MEFLKNPLVLAIIAAGLTYAYMYWDNKKKKEENPKANIEDISYTTPIIVGFLTLFISHSLFSFNTPVPVEELKVPVLKGGNSIINQPVPRMTDTFNSETYYVVGKNNIKLPEVDVFIDMAKF